jgi:L-lactate dehydrogenase complex protein LldG
VSEAREQFLARVRRAVEAGNPAGGSPPLPERGQVGRQGAGPDPVARLRDELTAAGGVFHPAADAAEAAARVVAIVRERSARRVLLGDGEVLSLLGLEKALAEAGVEVWPVARLAAPADTEAFFAADVGVSGVEAVVAETGTLVLATRRDQPSALSLLPPVHVAVAHRGQVVADLFDLFEGGLRPEALPACASLITGPSKTGDIELRLVTGVHGPGEVHLVLFG